MKTIITIIWKVLLIIGVVVIIYLILTPDTRPNFIDQSTINVISVITLSLMLFVIFREVFLWYFRINDLIKVLDIRLKEIADKLDKNNNN